MRYSEWLLMQKLAITIVLAVMALALGITATTVCYQCYHELYPNGKIIFNDPLAKQDSKGIAHISIRDLN